MNKKLKLIGYLFNNFPKDLTFFTRLEKEDMLKYLLNDYSVLEGIDEIIDIQNKEIDIRNHSSSVYNNKSWLSNPNSFIIISGDTVSNQIYLSAGTITLGTTKMTEDDLKKIKKSANIT